MLTDPVSIAHEIEPARAMTAKEHELSERNANLSGDRALDSSMVEAADLIRPTPSQVAHAASYRGAIQRAA